MEEINRKLKMRDSSIETVKLDRSEIDLRMISKEVQSELPLWVLVHEYGINNFVAYAVSDVEQHFLFGMGILKDGKVVKFLKGNTNHETVR
ncbi:hypothetical protein [Lactiplantibacillus paraplantarum]|uniref:hypothetical protein n=1 Tax=Lactiplantibacillus paraplantarum TaxID=60520 RepID=UPI0023AB05F7|nr:hypothetical protein [Lactiplantibacillus paraplantarum]WEE36053.1 hypothetical protein PWO93_00230 [Lactiplantibacillus paraplantarum]